VPGEQVRRRGQILGPAHIGLEHAARAEARQVAGAGQQAVEIGEGLVELRGQIAVVARLVADHGSGAGNVQLGRMAGTAHRAREGRRGRSVFARIAPGADLARILDCRTGRARGQPVDLQHGHAVAAADGAGRGEAFAVQFAHAGRAAGAEVLVALVVAGAVVDRGQIVPDAQQMRPALCAREPRQLPVGRLGRRGQVRMVGFGHFDRAEAIVRRSGPAHEAVPALLDRSGRTPDLERRGTAERLQSHAQIARIGGVRRGRAEAEHREHVGLGKQTVQSGFDVCNVQRRQDMLAAHAATPQRPATEHGIGGNGIGGRGPCTRRNGRANPYDTLARRSGRRSGAAPTSVEFPMAQLTPAERELAELLVDSLNLEGVSPDQFEPEAALFGGDLGLDSIDALEIALAVSKRYGFQLRSDNEENKRIFGSLRALSAHIEQNRVN